MKPGQKYRRVLKTLRYCRLSGEQKEGEIHQCMVIVDVLPNSFLFKGLGGGLTWSEELEEDEWELVE